MFIINLRRLAQAPIELSGEIAEGDSIWGDPGFELASPVSVVATAEGSPTRGVTIHGSLSGRVRRECRRCLEGMESVVSEDFDLLFDPKVSLIEEDIRVYALDSEADKLDLKPALRERFVLAVPTYTVCRPDCRGLCDSCGANLNEETCECSPGGPDPRWGPLTALRKES